MITYEEALKEANKVLKGINKCVEYKHGYMFAKKTDKVSYGGGGAPVVILKESGKPVSMAYFAAKYEGEPIREIDI